MKNLPYSVNKKVLSLSKVGLSYTGQSFLENFMLAEKNGGGHNNRAVLLKRIRFAPDSAKAAAMAIYDGFVNGKK